MKRMWQAGATLLLAFAAATPASAGCVALLETMAPHDAPEMLLGDCDVQARLVEGPGGTSPNGASVVLAVRGPALARWRAALGGEGALARAMLAAELRLDGRTPTLPGGLLLSSHSARMVREAHWDWDSQAGELRWSPATASTAAAPCAAGDAGTPVLWIGTREVAPGGLIAAQPFYAVRPGVASPVAANCLAGWMLSPAAPAALQPALGLVVVAPDARDGTRFMLKATIAGRAVEGEVRVSDPALHPLAGRWHQTMEQVCGTPGLRVPARPIGELVFTAAGEFSLTWQPFEAYRDYWGAYRHDRQSGALSLDITGGNRMPTHRQAAGQARLNAEGALVITGLDPGDGATAPACTMVFKRD